MVIFLLFAIVQLFGINSIDMYSSGVTLQAIGVPVKRYQAVLVDCVIALGVTMWAIFSASFTPVSSPISWTWSSCGSRRGAPSTWSTGRCVTTATSRARSKETGRDSLYWNKGGIFWAAWVAQVLGMFAAISLTAGRPPSTYPSWLNLFNAHTRDSFGYGGDLSVFFGMGVAGLVYLALGLEQGAQGR